MRLIPDKTGRFAERPFFEEGELDAECEKLVTQFLTKKYGSVKFPIATEDLKCLVETKADLDVYVTLNEGEEGKTDFRRKKPDVHISEVLSSEPRYENRFRGARHNREKNRVKEPDYRPEGDCAAVNSVTKCVECENSALFDAFSPVKRPQAADIEQKTAEVRGQIAKAHFIEPQTASVNTVFLPIVPSTPRAEIPLVSSAGRGNSPHTILR